LPPRSKHHFRKINKKKSSRRGVLSKILAQTNIKVTTSSSTTTIEPQQQPQQNVIQMSSKVMTAQINLCPNFEIPMPVKLAKIAKISSTNIEVAKNNVVCRENNMATTAVENCSSSEIPIPNSVSSSKSPTKKTPIKIGTTPKSPRSSAKSPRKKLKRKLDEDTTTTGQDPIQTLVKADQMTSKADDKFAAKMKQKSILSYFCAKQVA
jgi:hypothetical protein